MPIDHSVTYKSSSLRNWPHRKRLRDILRVLEKNAALKGKTYADVGCSNGYITSIIQKHLSPATTHGFDHDEANIELAKERFPACEFEVIDLNSRNAPLMHFDVVTSFEVLEHVGSLNIALENILSLVSPHGGLLVLTVPIEIGWVGTLKFLLKTCVFRYSLNEISTAPGFHWQYLRSLLMGRRISGHRSERDGWSTHFGFDYRDIDSLLNKQGVRYKASNRLTSRFYLVTKGPNTQC